MAGSKGPLKNKRSRIKAIRCLPADFSFIPDAETADGALL